MNRPSQFQLSPKSLALAIGVSESSMKRWIDQGQLPVHITSGGHRRISFSDAIKFIRAHKRTIVDPSALGLGGSEGTDSGINQSELVDVLKTGDSAHLSNLLLQLYLNGHDLPTLFEALLPEFRLIGELGLDDSRCISTEHLYSTTFAKALSQLQLYLPAVNDMPIAIGGTLAPDSSYLSSLLAETVILSTGMRTMNLGGNTPITSMLETVEEFDAKLVWVSVVHQSDMYAINVALENLYNTLQEKGVRFVVGGPALQSSSTSHSFLEKHNASLHEVHQLASSLVSSN
jgi:MerR family transcriptional regulator, light-induced transcriptional regulator